ncbi:MAG: CHASE2 domain-containing protein, partial [Armatimonadetes bacterium]|nr:CHASE2 domain-containing protein [Armatimonadota bacterium]
MRDNFLSKKNLIYFGFSFIIFILLNFKTPLFSNLLINIRLKWLDYLIQRKPERAPVKDLILINIDKDNSLQKYGRWPWNRLLFKKALDILTESGAKIVIFDFYLNQKTKEDQSLIQAVNKHKRVIFALPWDSASRMLSTPPENFLKSKAYFGHVIPGRIISDQFRGVALFIKTPIIQKIEYLSLSLMAVLLKDNLQNFPINFNDKNLIIGKYKIPLLKNEENLPLMLINFTGKRGNFRRHNQEYYYDELIERKISKEVFKDKIVLIYNSFEPNDQFLTPVSAEARIPGGEIHANAINTILQNDYIIPYFNSDIFIIILILINALIFYKFSYWRKRILLLLSLNIILLSSSIFLFKKNLWFDITSPFLISFIFSIFILTYENKKVKELF